MSGYNSISLLGENNIAKLVKKVFLRVGLWQKYVPPLGLILLVTLEGCKAVTNSG